MVPEFSKVEVARMKKAYGEQILGNENGWARDGDHALYRYDLRGIQQIRLICLLRFEAGHSPLASGLGRNKARHAPW